MVLKTTLKLFKKVFQVDQRSKKKNLQATQRSQHGRARCRSRPGNPKRSPEQPQGSKADASSWLFRGPKTATQGPKTVSWAWRQSVKNLPQAILRPKNSPQVARKIQHRTTSRRKSQNPPAWSIHGPKTVPQAVQMFQNGHLGHAKNWKRSTKPRQGPKAIPKPQGQTKDQNRSSQPPEGPRTVPRAIQRILPQGPKTVA